MADPFTIATTVPTLVLQVGKAVKQLTDLVERYSRASTTLISLWTESNVVRSALGNLERILSKEENSARLDPVMVDDIDRAIHSCAVSISELVKEIDSIGVQLTDTHGETKLKALTKWKILWKEDDMKRLLDRLRGHSSMFSFLLLTLTHESILETARLFTLNRPAIAEMNEETLSRCQERHLLVPQCGVPRYTDSVRDAATEIGTPAPSQGDPAAFPLVEELFGCGTDYHMAVSIFQRSNNSAEEVRDMLSEWKALCADYEFHVITRCLLHNGPDLDAANGTLQELYNLAGPTLWPKIMTIVERWGFNLSLTVLRLGLLRKLGTEVDFVRILNALEGNMYNYQTTREHISRISDTKYCRDIGHGVEVWGACSFDVDAAVKKLGGKPIPFFGKCFIALWCCGMLFMVAGLFGLIDV